MAVDAFLKIEGIKGESVDSKHKGEIEILSWSWGATNQPGAAGSGPRFTDFTFTHKYDKASPLLMKAVISDNTVDGETFQGVYFTVRKAGDKPLEYLKIKLQDCIVSSVQSAADPGQDRGTEQITLNFTVVNVQYFLPNNPKSPASEVTLQTGP